MSELRSQAARALRAAVRVFQADLDALPEDGFDKKFGPKCRTVADIVYEVNMVNDQLRMELRGEPTPGWPEGGWVTAPAGFEGKHTVTEAFRTSTDSLRSTAEEFSETQLAEPLATGEGETSREERVRFATLHLWYHSGQLNFIQTLLGDDAWHWG